MYIKVVDGTGKLVRVEILEEPGWVRYDEAHDRVLRCTQAQAQGVVSADSGVVYNFGSTAICAELTAESISAAEYDTLQVDIPDPEDEDPEIPDDPGGDGEKPMTRAELTEAVAALEKANTMLMGMLLDNREDSMTASKAYSAGDLIIVSGELYKAQSRIASGAALTVGTNVKQTTLAAEIAAVNS